MMKAIEMTARRTEELRVSSWKPGEERYTPAQRTEELVPCCGRRAGIRVSLGRSCGDVR